MLDPWELIRLRERLREEREDNKQRIENQRKPNSGYRIEE